MRRALQKGLMIAAAPIFALGLMAAEPAPAPDKPLAAAEQEQRARALFAEIRCVVCQHESIADSPAGVAADMRRLVREEVAAGRSDDQIREGLVGRYGDYVLFRPPVRLGTWLLWFGPFVLVALAGAGLWLGSRRRAAEVSPLDADEEAALAALLESEPRSEGGDEHLQSATLRPDDDASAPHDGR